MSAHRRGPTGPATGWRCTGPHTGATNPEASQVLGERCYPDLCSVREAVDVFGRLDEAMVTVAEAITVGGASGQSSPLPLYFPECVW